MGIIAYDMTNLIPYRFVANFSNDLEYTHSRSCKITSFCFEIFLGYILLQGFLLDELEVCLYMVPPFSWVLGSCTSLRLWSRAKNKENWLLVTDEPVEFEKKPVEVQGFKRTTHHSRGVYGTYPNSTKEDWKMSMDVTGWTWKH